MIIRVNMNKKGFVFAELLVVTVVLMVGLLVIYKQFSTSINYQKQKLQYQNVADTYKLYYMTQEFLKSINTYCYSTTSGKNCFKLGQRLGLVSSNTVRYAKANTSVLPSIEEKMSTYNVFNSNEYISTICSDITYSSDSITKVKSALNSMSLTYDFHSYAKTLKKCDNLENFRFISSFKNAVTGKYTYSTYEYPY